MSARFVLDPADLSGIFTAATIARGAGYAHGGRIHDVTFNPDTRVLGGLCRGSGARVYRVDVALEDIRGDLYIAWASCSCPVGWFCKHAVALLLAASNTPTSASPVAPDRWRAVVTALLDDITPPDGDGGGAPIGLEFSLVPAGYRLAPALALRPLTVGKRGTWIKRGVTWRDVRYQRAPGAFNRRQLRALQTLAAELDHPGPIMVGDYLMTSWASPALWPALRDADDAGIAMVPDQSSGLRAVEFIKNAQLTIDLVADGTGGATMSSALMVDGQRCDSSETGLIGQRAPHGMYQVVDGVLRLGAFNPLPGAALLGLLGDDERVSIPAESVEEFTVEVLPRLSAAVTVYADDEVFTPPTIEGPYAVLTFAVADRGIRAFWSTRYHVNGKNHDFARDSASGVTAYRDPSAETAVWQQVSSALAAAGSPIADLGSTVVLTEVEFAVLHAEVLPRLADNQWLIVEVDGQLPDLRAARRDPYLEFAATEAVHTDWFDLDVTVNVDDTRVALSDVIAEIAAGATHMLLPNGVYFPLDTVELNRLRTLLDEARALGEIDGGRVNRQSLNVTLWEDLLDLGVVDTQLARWRRTLGRLAAARPPTPVENPAGLRATLRDYQRDGLNWLAFLWDNGLGGVLADDMGLGKTVQTLALIARAVATGAERFLVVAPTSVVSNWVAEAAKFTPELKVVAVTATEARSGGRLASIVADAHIVVTSYALVRLDFDAYDEIEWAGMILDEAQFVKNRNSKTHQAVRRLSTAFKVAITGTPMENNLMELWSLLSITVPGLFPSPTAFGAYFGKPIESGGHRERLTVLRRRIKPVLLRRTKSQVIAELPPKHEQVIAVELGTKHRKIYDTRLARERQKVLGLLGDWEKNKFQIFRSLTVLRQLSLHPGLVDQTDMTVGSAKIDFLVDQLPQLVAEGHKALVFSQFTGFLGLLRARLDAIGVEYSYLDGAVNARGRAAALETFRAGGTAVFLISLKAGGFGLNLTEADYCFLCDPWWSPAAEAQAVDRTHRIGQTRPVTVYRLVSTGTIEEKVVALQARKRELFRAVMDDGDLFSSALTAADVRELLG
ncbi:helicase SNF2 [Mycolicibacillus koreensis]|nr:helicase SNF2 [Mycolicibacillus koreensis]